MIPGDVFLQVQAYDLADAARIEQPFQGDKKRSVAKDMTQDYP